MSQQHRETYDRSLVMFQSKLDILRSMLQGVANPTAPDGVERVRYLWNKKSILEAVKDLETWQALTDQSWFLFMTITDAGIDAALAAKSSQIPNLIPSTSTIRSSCILSTPLTGAKLMLPHGEIDHMEICHVPFSEVKSAKRARPSGAPTIYILNEMCNLQSPPGSHFSRYTVAKEDSGQLASRLQHQEPEKFGLLTCKGFTLSGTKADPKITLVLRTPPDVLPCPRSLRELLLSTNTPGSLTQRLDIAKGLANAVGYVHVFGFVHKNIRPESVLCFTPPDGKTISTFLVGFELFRRDMGWTQRLGDVAPDKNLYRHPSRQGINPELNYTMQHDVYSLGVCLLEIGLWRTFVNYTISNNGVTPQISDIFQPSSGTSYETLSRGLVADTKEKLVSLARDELPQYMGNKYSEVTMACLNFLNETNVESSDGSEAANDQEILMGVNYIEKVSPPRILTDSF